tara:strand:- start:1249 stop:2043 length:795 start_codon:yes stop_codon:yes gene_type:complete
MPADLRFCRVQLDNATLVSHAICLETDTPAEISNAEHDHLFVALPPTPCTVILHARGAPLAVAHCPVDTPSTVRTAGPATWPADLPQSIFQWHPLPRFDAATGVEEVCTRASLARACLHRQPFAAVPELHQILLHTASILDLSDPALCGVASRALAWQCVGLALRGLTSSVTPTSVTRCLFDLARSWHLLAPLLPTETAEAAQPFFHITALLEHSPRPGVVRVALTGELRDVVVMRTKKVKRGQGVICAFSRGKITPKIHRCRE